MTAKGRLARGKANAEYVDYKGNVGRFLDNPETKEYLKSLPKEEVKKPTEVKKNAKSDK